MMRAARSRDNLEQNGEREVRSKTRSRFFCREYFSDKENSPRRAGLALWGARGYSAMTPRAGSSRR